MAWTVGKTFLGGRLP